MKTGVNRLQEDLPSSETKLSLKAVRITLSNWGKRENANNRVFFLIENEAFLFVFQHVPLRYQYYL